LSTPDRAAGELGHWWPDLLPDRGHVIFSAFRTPVDRSRIGVLDLATREVRWVVEGGYFGRYVSSGHLLYTKGSRVYALPFDAKSVTATGPAVAVVDDVFTGHTGGFTSIAISSQGAVAYVTSSLGDPPRELLWLDRTGRATPVNTPRRRFLSVSLSPDDSRAALTILEESRDLWTLSFDRGTLSRLTSGQETEYDPRWSRDGRELFYVLDRPPFELHRIAAGGQTPGRPIWKEPAELDTQGIAVSPDGRTIAFNRTEEGTGENVYIRPIDGSEPPKAIRASRSDERNSSFSPDGRYLVYEDDDTGRLEIYVQSISDPSDRTQLSTDGGTQPLWARNGEIFFRHDDEMRVVTTRLTGRFTFDTPRKLFDLPFATGYRENDARVYDVSATGSRILIVSIPVEQRPRQIEVVIDWTTGLNRLAPAGPR
jgi:serine/threonine-protein kinase